MKKVKKLLNIFVFILGVNFLLACADIEELIKETSDEQVNDSAGEQPIEDEKSIENENPIVNDIQYWGNDGNVWKPISDGGGPNYTGNVVILFSSKFKKEFKSCKAELKNGEKYTFICINNASWTQIPFSCFSNGNRQTLRSTQKCDRFKNTTVICDDGKQEVIFKARSNNRQACNRQG